MVPLDAGTRHLGSVASFTSRDGRAPSEAIDAYKRDGVICLRGAFGRDWLDVIEQGIARFLAEQGATESAANVVVKGEVDEGSFRYATLMWKTLEPFRRVIFDSHAADLFGSLLETRTVNLYYDFLLIKQARCRSAVTPWHQDHSYYCMNGTKLINCWTALDAIPRETALRFVKGSHLPGQVYRAVHFDPAREYPGTLKERALPPDFDSDPSVEILTCEMAPGDALVWNSRTFHSAPGNHLDRRRAALSLNFAGDDVTYFDMAQEPDPPIRGEGLVDGGPITCASFPLLRQW
jgi:ectoine hydroxylase-related dioxygenase (phytanoyl-CoA dioxygenase family)